MGQWQSWAEFWSMGGRAFYVWWSYGVFFALIVLELYMLRRNICATWQRLRRWYLAMGEDAVHGAIPSENRPPPR